MNSLIRRSNTINPKFDLNDSSPTSLQKKQRLESLHAVIQEEQLSEFTKYYRKEVRKESLINSQPIQNDQLHSNNNSNNHYYQLHSKQTIDISDINDENQSRASFEALSPLKKTSKSLAMNKCVYSSGFPQLSTCLSFQNSDIKSPNFCQSSKRVNFSPLQNVNSKQGQLESFRSANETIQLIKMQNTFLKKKIKPQNQQFLEKCLGQLPIQNRESGYQTPIKSQKYIPFNQSTGSKSSIVKLDAFSQQRGVRLQEMDFLTILNNESQNTIKTDKSCSMKVQRATSLIEYMKTRQSTDRIIDSKRESSFQEKIPLVHFQKKALRRQNQNIRSQSQIFIHKDKDFTMNSPLNFSKHLKSLEELYQSEKNRKKIRQRAEDLTKNFRDSNSDIRKKQIKIIVQQDLDQSEKKKESKSQSRNSSIEQIHQFKKQRNEPAASQDYLQKERKSILFGSNNQINQMINSSKQTMSPPNSLSAIADKQIEDSITNSIKLANETHNQLQKLFCLRISRYKIVKILKSFLSGQSLLLNILLDENKQNLNQEINAKMLEDLISNNQNQNQEEKLLIEHELIYLRTKIQEYILQQQIQQCEIYKQDILSGCQNLQDIANSINMRNKTHKVTAFKTLESLSFMIKPSNLLNLRNILPQEQYNQGGAVYFYAINQGGAVYLKESPQIQHAGSNIIFSNNSIFDTYSFSSGSFVLASLVQVTMYNSTITQYKPCDIIEFQKFYNLGKLFCQMGSMIEIAQCKLTQQQYHFVLNLDKLNYLRFQWSNNHQIILSENNKFYLYTYQGQKNQQFRLNW
ncbi:hypothetical protein ABPG72_016898 [Tetrahymena utriculariae]